MKDGRRDGCPGSVRRSQSADKQKEGFFAFFFCMRGEFYSSSGSGVCSDAAFPSVFLAFSFGIHL